MARCPLTRMARGTTVRASLLTLQTQFAPGNLHQEKVRRREDSFLALLTDLGARCAILTNMRSWASRITVTLVLLTCLVCPLLETFDTWDHTVQTGNDTEYALVVLALCVGVAYSFTRFIFKSAPLAFVAKSVFASCPQKSFFSAPCSFTFLLFDATSPPRLPLRI